MKKTRLRLDLLLVERGLFETRAKAQAAVMAGSVTVNGEVRVVADDRAALERLLRYVLRPAISLKRLSYRPEKDLVRYWPAKGRPEAVTRAALVLGLASRVWVVISGQSGLQFLTKFNPR